jgi:ribosomal protein S27AE
MVHIRLGKIVSVARLECDECGERSSLFVAHTKDWLCMKAGRWLRNHLTVYGWWAVEGETDVCPRCRDAARPPALQSNHEPSEN